MSTQTKEIAPVAQSAQATVIKPIETIRTQFKFADDGSVQFIKGAKVSCDELALAVSYECDVIGSASIRAVNLMRCARQLDDVKGEGDKTTKAFDYVAAKVSEQCNTPATFANVRALIECADIADKNGLTCSPFSVKEALGFMRKMNLMDESEAHKGALKFTNPVTLALKNGKAVNAIRPVIQAAKKVANEEAEKEGKQVPFPTRATAKPAPVVAEVTVAMVMHSIAIARHGATVLCEKGKAAELKAAMSASEDFKSLMALIGK